MSLTQFKCNNCGYIPRDKPTSGRWFCPKCGKVTKIASSQPRVTRKYDRKPVYPTRSRDQVMDQIFQDLVKEKKPNLGYKEPYIHPEVPVIIPKLRYKLRLFLKEKSK